MQLILILFVTYKGVLNTADWPVQSNPAIAPLIISDAVPDLIHPPFFCLVYQVWITELRSDHADHIGLSVSEDLLRKRGGR